MKHRRSRNAYIGPRSCSPECSLMAKTLTARPRVQEALVQGIDLVLVAGSARLDGLDALALDIAQQPQCVGGERGSPSRVAEYFVDGARFPTSFDGRGRSATRSATS